MKFSASLLFLLVCCHKSSSLLQSKTNVNTRRAFFKSAFSTAASFALASPALAKEDGPPPQAPKEEKVVKKEEAPKKTDEKKAVTIPPKKKDESTFVGSYTDPNHPGGKTTIRLTGQSVGDYVLAEVVGGGGKNEPANYLLPAVLMGERTIFIDFTSKGGPRNFVGFLNKDGDIDFLKDGNRWSRI